MGLLVALIALLPRLAAADDWEPIRKTVIDPINSAFHRHLPRAIQALDEKAVRAFYVTDTGTGLRWDSVESVDPGREEQTLRWKPPGGPEPIRERVAKLLAVFSKVEKAEGRIHRVHWDDVNDQGMLAELRTLVRGTRKKDGARVQLDQWTKIRITKRDGEWRIASEEVTARDLVARAKPRFAVATESAGIANVHTNETSPEFRLIGGTRRAREARLPTSTATAARTSSSPAARTPRSTGTVATASSRT